MVDTKLRIWDNMITINRKDTYERSHERRSGRVNGGSRSVRCGSNSGYTGAREANRPGNAGSILEASLHRERSAQRKAGASGARSNSRARRVALEVRAHASCQRHPKLGVFSKTFRRITNRALRGPYHKETEEE